MQAPLPPRRFTFGGFEVDARTRELTRQGAPVRVPDQSVQVLLALLERSGDVVTREELRDRLWAADTYVDFEHGLNSAVRRLRQALGDSADSPTFIETLPRRGYRFVAEVSGEPAEGTRAMNPETAIRGRQSLEHVPRMAADSPSVAASRRVHVIPYLGWLLPIPLTVLALVIVRVSTHVPDDGQWSATPVRLTFEDGLQTEPSLSRDGQQVAYAADLDGNFDIWTRRIAGGKPVRVTSDSADDWQPDWSPDGNSVAFRSERGTGGIFVVPATGGPEQKVADFGFRPLWSPDGERIVFGRSMLNAAATDLHVVDLNGNAPRRLSASSGAFGWEPQSRTVFVLTNFAGPFQPFATSIDTDTGAQQQWSFDPGVARLFYQRKLAISGGERLHWTSNRGSVFFIGDVQGSRRIWRLDVNRSSRRVIRGPFPVTTQPDASHFTLSADGQRIVFDASSRAARIWAYALDDETGIRLEKAEALTPEATHVNALDLSRDGTTLLFVLARPSSRQRREVVTRDLSTGREQTLRVIDDDRGNLVFPRLSNDGYLVSYTLITVASNGTPEQRVVVFNRAVGRETPLTSPTTPDVLEAATSWTPDDQFIVASSGRYVPGQCAVALLPLSAAPAAETQAQVVTSAKDMEFSQAAMSPDRRWIVFHVRELSHLEVSYLAVVSARGGDPSQWHLVTGRDANADKPRWSATGDALYFTTDNGAGINVFRVAFDSEHGRPIGVPRQLTKFGGPSLQIQPDIWMLELGIAGGRLVLPLVHARGGLWMTERN